MEQSNQEQTLQSQDNPQSESQQAASQSQSEKLSQVSSVLAAKSLRKVAIAKRREESSTRKYIEQIIKERSKLQKRIETELRILKSQIGKKDFAMLKDICTVNVPEQKNSEGQVVQEASSHVNKQALIVEARHLLALRREDRIKKGLRKRTTGRSSRRIAHRSIIKMLDARNKNPV